MRAAVCVALLLIVAGSVLAQDSNAPHLAPDNQVLYAHHVDGTDEAVGYMNTLATDKDATDIAMGAPAEAVTERDWSLSLQPSLVYGLTLKGDVVVAAHLGSGSGNGIYTVSTQLLYDGEVIADGAGQRHVVQQAGAAAYGLVSWTIPVDAVLAPGGVLEWTLHAEGAGTAIFLSVSEERGKSNMVLPVVSVDFPSEDPGPQLYETNLTGQAATAFVQINETSSDTHLFHWMTDAASIVLNYAAAVEAGSASVNVSGPDGEVFAMNFVGDEGGNMTFENAAGGWTISIALEGFQGALTIQLVEPVTSGGETPTDGSTTRTSTESTTSTTATDSGSQSTTSTTPAGDEESPGLGLVALLVAFAAIAAVRRH